MSQSQGDKPEETELLPYETSLCHRCAAPPRYVRSDKGSVFIHCPILKRYPPQPVLACDAFTPRNDEG